LAKKNGKFVTEDWARFMSWDEVVYVSEGRTPEEIKETVSKAYKVILPPSKICGAAVIAWLARLPRIKCLALSRQE